MQTKTAIESLYTLETDSTLTSAAYGYVSRGYPVVPVNEDKRPALKSWKEYQYKYPSPDKLRLWFDKPGPTGKRAKGLAIVCGELARLAVADFDNAEAAAKFRRDYPHLADTYTVISANRNTPHFYFRLSDPLLRLPKRKGQLGDFISNGGYVVAAPSRTAKGVYRVANNADPLLITRADYDIILKALGVSTVTESAPVVISRSAMSGDALELFAHNTKNYGSRNRGMYETMRYLKAQGWSGDEIRDTLLTAFIDAQPVTTHRPEKPSTRAREFEASLKSAFAKHRNEYTHNGIPNIARETLMQLGETVAARVLDGLHMAGIDYDALHTERDLLELLKASAIPIGRKAVRSLLTMKLGENELCSQISAIQHRDTYINVCVGEKRGQNRKGRKPANYYRVPSPLELCDLLRVKPSPAHTLKPEDLKTSKAYRVALHRAVIRNNPKRKFTRAWLADRLGVSIRSTRNYDHRAGYKSIAQKVESPLTPYDLQSLPDSKRDAFGYIEINGKRFAPVAHHRTRFIRALEAGKRVMWVKYTGIKYIPNTDKVKAQAVEDNAKIQRNRREFEKVAKAHRDLRNSKKKTQKEATETPSTDAVSASNDTPQQQDTMPAVTPKTPEIAPQRDIDPLLKLGAVLGATVAPASGSGARQ